MSIYYTAAGRVDDYMKHLNGKQTTLNEAMYWATREIYHHDETVRLLAAMTLHLTAMDKEKL